jgi:hypothetical protein
MEAEHRQECLCHKRKSAQVGASLPQQAKSGLAGDPGLRSTVMDSAEKL